MGEVYAYGAPLPPNPGYATAPEAVRKVVFQYCEKNGIPHSFSPEKQAAGRNWFHLFLARHPQLCVRKPEATSIQRALGFIRAKTEIYKVLKSELFDEDGVTCRIPPENSFNVDESGFTVNQKPRKIVAQKGKSE